MNKSGESCGLMGSQPGAQFTDEPEQRCVFAPFINVNSRPGYPACYPLRGTEVHTRLSIFGKGAVTPPNTPDAPWGTVETRFDPIHSAARMRDAEAVKREIDAGVDVDVLNGRAANGDGGNTALWFAAQGPPPSGGEVARLLIAAGADVNRQCEHGRTALLMAAAWGHLDVVELLVQHGADPNLRDDQGMTPLEVAVRSKRVPEARLKPVIEYLNASV